MTFSSIIIKNVKFNFKKYIAYFSANTFIIAILLMYGSLLFSKEFGGISKASGIKGDFLPFLVLMGAFSIVFISYTTISFIRYRGKEFGVYLTLGVTTKDLMKILLIENITILGSSVIIGMIVGTIFSRMFYMILGKILKIDEFKPNLNLNMYLLCMAIAVIIFIINSIFEMIFIRRLSITELIKSSATREVSKGRVIIGTLALIILIVALCLFPKVIKREIFKEYQFAIVINIGAVIITPYFIIGSMIAVISSVLKRFKRSYNNSLLVLSSLNHKFISYKSVIFLGLILSSAAMMFISMAYSMYKVTEKEVNKEHSYDVSFIETTNYNKISKDEIREIVKSSGGEIEEYKVLEYLELSLYYISRDSSIRDPGKIGVVSESNYNKHMGTNINVSSGDLVEANVSENQNSGFANDGIIIDFDDISKQEKQREILQGRKKIDIEEFLATMDKNSYIYTEGEEKTHIRGAYTNRRDTGDYSRGTAFIISDEDYKKAKDKSDKDSISYDHLINLKKHDDYKSFNSISIKLNELNGGDTFLDTSFKQETFDRNIKSNGFMLFSSLFLGLMFLISSGVVLYFKVLTGVDEEKERVKSLIKLGMTGSEISKVLTKELAIIFFVPVVLATGLVLYLLFQTFNIVSDGDFMFNKSLYVFGAYIVLQTIAFLITRTKYIKETVME